jgi:hypothetical protein
MSKMLAHPKIYHLTHIDNLKGMVDAGRLYSDAERVARGISCALVGMSSIKERRLTELEVKCHPGTLVGQYVPFYFCARSVMLYLLHKGNHPELTYRDGQRPIIHLQADVAAVIQWADAHDVPWAFTDRNAGAYLAEFHNASADLAQLDWKAIGATDFRGAQVKEAKQAEFLVFGEFPWALVEEIGVIDRQVAREVQNVLGGAAHAPPVIVKPQWYY